MIRKLLDYIRPMVEFARHDGFRSHSRKGCRLESGWGDSLEKKVQPRMYKVEELRNKIQGAGWTLKELPIRSGGPEGAKIRAWKMIAIKANRSIDLTGLTLDEAMTNVARTLGLIR